MCRALYALEHGNVVSKPVACRWALDAVEARWRPLIDAVLRKRFDGLAREEVLTFVRFVVAHSAELEGEQV